MNAAIEIFFLVLFGLFVLGCTSTFRVEFSGSKTEEKIGELQEHVANLTARQAQLVRYIQQIEEKSKE